MRLFYFDLETHLFHPGNMDPKPVSIAWKDNLGNRGLALAHRIPEIIGPPLEDAVKNRTTVLCGHGVEYDFTVIHRWFANLRGLIWDAYEAMRVTCTMVREHLLDIGTGELRGTWVHGKWIDYSYNLAAITKRRLGVEMPKGEDTYRKRYAELDGVPVEQWPTPAVTYAMADVDQGYALCADQEERGRNIGYTMPTQWDDARAAFGLKLTSNSGLRTNEQRVLTLHRNTQAKMRELGETLTRHGLARWKTMAPQIRMWGEDDERVIQTNMKAVRSRVEATFVGEKVPTTETGLISTAKNTIEMCHDDGLKAYVDFNALRKRGSTYVKRLFDGIEYPIHTSFGATGAGTNRTRSWNPNMQNPPRLGGVRECFEPDQPDQVFIACDYNTMECRTWAQACVDFGIQSRMAQMYRQNPSFDPHQQFADEFFPGMDDGRQRAKAGNFGFPGGLGWQKFMAYARGYGLELSPDEARSNKEGWQRTWPEEKGWFAVIRGILGGRGYGRLVVPRTGFRRDRVGYCDGANTSFQHIAAQAAKRAIYYIARACYDERITNNPLAGCRPKNFVHDEVVVQGPVEGCHEIGMALQHLMCESMRPFTPDVSPQATASAGYVWSKGAKPVYEQGRLVPWVPKETH